MSPVVARLLDRIASAIAGLLVVSSLLFWFLSIRSREESIFVGMALIAALVIWLAGRIYRVNYSKN